MKKFVRTTAALNLFMGEKAVYFVVYIKQETLQVIARYLVAETMIGPIQLIIRCLNRILFLLAPMTNAAIENLSLIHI